ncbi:hypothetical protein DDT91_03050 [Algoriphagus sp. AK58]|nr:hypothetical protein [Algoriphagus sp. AK58]
MQNPLTAIHLSKRHETSGLRFLRFSALKGKPKTKKWSGGCLNRSAALNYSKVKAAKKQKSFKTKD